MTPKDVRLQDVFHLSGPMFIVSGAVGAEMENKLRNALGHPPLKAPSQSPAGYFPFAPQLLRMAYADIDYIGKAIIRYASMDGEARRLHYPLATTLR